MYSCTASSAGADDCLMMTIAVGLHVQTFRLDHMVRAVVTHVHPITGLHKPLEIEPGLGFLCTDVVNIMTGRVIMKIAFTFPFPSS